MKYTSFLLSFFLGSVFGTLSTQAFAAADSPYNVVLTIDNRTPIIINCHFNNHNYSTRQGVYAKISVMMPPPLLDKKKEPSYWIICRAASNGNLVGSIEIKGWQRVTNEGDKFLPKTTSELQATVKATAVRDYVFILNEESPNPAINQDLEYSLEIRRVIKY